MAAIVLTLAWRARRDGARVGPACGAALGGMLVPIGLWLAWILLPDPSRAFELLDAFVNRDEGLRGLAGSALLRARHRGLGRRRRWPS